MHILSARRKALGLLAVALAALAALAAAPSTALAAGTVPVYRLWNYYDGQHLITTDENEYRVLQRRGWQGEGVVFELPQSGGVSVFRLVNNSNGDHLYTSNADEYAALQRGGWTGEGPKFNGAPAGEGVPVYRLYNSAQTANGGLGSHLWTADGNEYASLPRMSPAWHQESVAWRAYPAPSLPANPSVVDGTNPNSSTTLYGTIVREQWTTDMTGRIWSGVYYFLKLDRPVTLKYHDIFAGKNTTYTKQTSKILLNFTERNSAVDSIGWERVNQDLDKLFIEQLQPYAGFRAAVTGSFGNMTGHTMVTPMFLQESIQRIG